MKDQKTDFSKTTKAGDNGAKRKIHSQNTSRKSASIGVRTNVLFLVSLILILGLMATVFISYWQSDIESLENFAYFSPAKYLNNISETTIPIPAGNYIVQEKKALWGFGTISPLVVRGYIDINGFVFESENLNNPLLADYGSSYTFVIGDKTYKSELSVIENEHGLVEVVNIVKLTESSFVSIGDPPDVRSLVDVWKDVNIVSFFSAVGYSVNFAVSYLDYVGNMSYKLMPWNSIENSSNASDVEIPWRDEQNNYIDP